MEKLIGFWESSGLANLTFGNLFMIALSCLLFYLAIKKDYEPLLLIPIGFGMLLVNLPWLVWLPNLQPQNLEGFCTIWDWGSSTVSILR